MTVRTLESMRSWAYTKIENGVENSIKMIERPLPSWYTCPPTGKHVVEVLSASLNPVDYKLPESPIESRVARIPQPASPGMDFCGRLVAQPDRIVFGRLSWPVQHGTLGQYVLVGDNDFVDLPKECSVEEGAAIGIAALTAYQSIVPFVKTGDRVVVNGGSGGVGTFSIQMAKLQGCYVVAVCSGRSAQLCTDLGADQIVNYKNGDAVVSLSELPPFDVIVDNVGKDTTLHHRSGAFLKHTGRFVSVSAMLGSVRGVLSMADSLLRPSWLGGPRIKYTIVLCQCDKDQLQQISAWIADEKLKVVIDEVFEFEDVPRAMAKLRTGRAKGKIVVRMT